MYVFQDECLPGRETETVLEEEEIDEEKSDGEIRKITEKINNLTVSDMNDSSANKDPCSKNSNLVINTEEKKNSISKDYEEKLSDVPSSPNTLSSVSTSGRPPKSPKSPRSPLSPRYMKMFPRTGSSDVEVSN